MLFDTHIKGEIGMLEVQKHAITKGIVVCKPTIECRYDLMFDFGTTISRVQVKYVEPSNDTYNLYLKKRVKTGKYIQYTAKDIDLIVAYLADRGDFILVDITKFAGKTGISFRRKGDKGYKTTNYIEDYSW